MPDTTAARPLRPRPARLLPILSLTALMLVPPGAGAQGYSGPGRTYVIGNDHGGRLRPRIETVRRMRDRGDRVEIRGNYCLSSCTVYLGAGNVCVSPRTRFGFHGPGYLDAPISRDRFNYWTRLMAAHYPPQVADWFMARARYAQHGYMTLTGAELIRMGVRRCGDA